ncbi:hypothetical protein IRJ41_025981 [Triplophysa rosa]|uniref:Uncharacterized protein n=1 Tax=Triplophysa rosa TaxID=992332 RepID=A0A9W7T9U4_TRIRA|nr:hypothetical protein IRJ41_025981 [Triplophysa rosa]
MFQPASCRRRQTKGKRKISPDDERLRTPSLPYAPNRHGDSFLPGLAAIHLQWISPDALRSPVTTFALT